MNVLRLFVAALCHVGPGARTIVVGGRAGAPATKNFKPAVVTIRIESTRAMDVVPATPFRRRSDTAVVESRERVQIAVTHAQIAETLAHTELKLRQAAELGTALSEREAALLSELDAKNALIDQQLAELGAVHAQREEALALADRADSQVRGACARMFDV